jgi:hypothetical protein
LHTLTGTLIGIIYTIISDTIVLFGISSKLKSLATGTTFVAEQAYSTLFMFFLAFSTNNDIISPSPCCSSHSLLSAYCPKTSRIDQLKCFRA